MLVSQPAQDQGPHCARIPACMRWSRVSVEGGIEDPDGLAGCGRGGPGAPGILSRRMRAADSRLDRQCGPSAGASDGCRSEPGPVRWPLWRWRVGAETAGHPGRADRSHHPQVARGEGGQAVNADPVGKVEGESAGADVHRADRADEHNGAPRVGCARASLDLSSGQQGVVMFHASGDAAVRNGDG